MHPAKTPDDASVQDAGVHVAFSVAFDNRREDFKINVVEKICRGLEQFYFLFGLDPSNLVHKVGTVEYMHVGQLLFEPLPFFGAYKIRLKADPLVGEPLLLEHRNKSFVGRFPICLVYLHLCMRRISARQSFGCGIYDHDRIAMAEPHKDYGTRGVGEFEMARKRARINDSRQVSEILARTEHQAGQIVLIHQMVQSRDVGYAVS